MIVIGVDFESQCAEAATTNITEVGAILADFSQPDPLLDSHRIEFFCYQDDYPPQTAHIVELTGITDTDLITQGIHPKIALTRLNELMMQADLVCAHNKIFDQTVYEAECKRQGLNPVPLPWLCTLTEIPYPEKFTCKKLSHLAWEHDIPVDRAALHRASYDVELMLKLLAKYELPKVLEYKNEPWVYMRAMVAKPWLDGGVEKTKASKLGYSWEKARGDDRPFPGWWVKRAKTSRVQSEQEKAQKLNLTVHVI